jgi:glycerophosphoryl diester phosphodiesterase
MKIVAHRGGSSGTPENTLAAFANAVHMQADLIELDIHLSSDGTPVVIHDATLDRTTDGTGPVNSYTRQELKQFNAGQGERIPTLDEVFELVGDRVPFVLELKSLDAVPATTELLKQFPAVRWMGLSGIPDALDALRAGFPHAELAVGTFGSRAAAERLIDLIGESEKVISKIFLERLRRDAETFDINDVFARAAELNATKLGVYWEGIDAELVASAHARGLQIGAWTVNDPEVALRLMKLGVDTLTSDDPATMLALVKTTRAEVPA